MFGQIAKNTEVVLYDQVQVIVVILRLDLFFQARPFGFS